MPEGTSHARCEVLSACLVLSQIENKSVELATRSQFELTLVGRTIEVKSRECTQLSLWPFS